MTEKKNTNFIPELFLKFTILQNCEIHHSPQQKDPKVPFSQACIPEKLFFLSPCKKSAAAFKRIGGHSPPALEVSTLTPAVRQVC